MDRTCRRASIQVHLLCFMTVQHICIHNIFYMSIGDRKRLNKTIFTCQYQNKCIFDRGQDEWEACMSGTPLEMNEVVGTQDYRSMVGRSSDGYANGALSINI